ncbi:MAG: TIGR03905 family TSCPD domain-containing protein [Coriobacteriales bacterium]|nr:TIGR03905 family TSCPD domain-containing protein [Coriobacteriales bacterium]
MPIRECKGVCASSVRYTVDGEGRVHDVSFSGGCHGNLQAVARLSEGREASEIITILEGVTCGHKGTSCPDQFAQALKAEC